MPRTNASSVARARAIGTAVHGAQPSFMPRPLSATMLPDGEPGHPEDEPLGERCHAAVPGEEDDRRSGEAEHEGSGHDEVDEEVRPERGEQQHEGAGHSHGRAARRHRSAGVGGGGRYDLHGTHSVRPNRPFGRTASTTARMTKVKMIE